MKAAISTIIFAIVFALTAMAAWVTHVIACIQAHAWILLFAGIFVPPIGWIHGVMVWLGMWH